MRLRLSTAQHLICALARDRHDGHRRGNSDEAGARRRDSVRDVTLTRIRAQAAYTTTAGGGGGGGGVS